MLHFPTMSLCHFATPPLLSRPLCCFAALLFCCFAPPHTIFPGSTVSSVTRSRLGFASTPSSDNTYASS
jgi:hypothetical protein